MEANTLWSLRLGFSFKEANLISNLGITKFLEASFVSKFDTEIPEFLNNSPKSFEELKANRKKFKDSNPEEKKEYLKREILVSNEMKAWWIEKMRTDALPLREKMTCFWHNHFVSSFQKVKVNYWIYDHNQLLRENAFGNFKELTKKIIKTNAMVRYLDNVDNRKGKYNENLSRELLELFTVGIGNYSEEDIKNGAKALAGLGFGEKEAQYRRIFEDNDPKTYFGKTGNFKSDDLVDIIFEQKAIPYLITRKILKWFIYDQPSEELVAYYGAYFRKVNFEIKPLLTKIFTEEYPKKNAGSKIKNPLEFSLELMANLNIENPNPKLIAFLIKEQGMDLFNQPNVKGWIGGNSWLTSQVYMQRNNVADLLCSGRSFNRKSLNSATDMNKKIPIQMDWDKQGTNLTIIANLKNKLLFGVDDATQLDFERILKYDFKPESENANQAVLRLFNEMVKLPEYQLI